MLFHSCSLLPCMGTGPSSALFSVAKKGSLHAVSAPCCHPSQLWACSVTCQKVHVPVARPQRMAFIPPFPALPEHSLQHFVLSIQFSSLTGSAAPRLLRIKAGPAFTPASNTCEMVPASLCCHPVATSSVATPDSIPASLLTALPMPRLGVLCRQGHGSTCLP